MKTLLRIVTIAAVTLVSFDAGTVRAQQQPIQCDFKNWVAAWLGNKIDAGHLKDNFADTICHFTTDEDYCKVSAKFKDFVTKQSNSYQNILASEVLLSQGSRFDACILCQARDLYQTVVKGAYSIQDLCRKIGDFVEKNRPNLKYAYSKMNCGFKMSQKALTDDAFGDSYWNSGKKAIRDLLAKRILPDLEIGRSDDVLRAEMEEVGDELAPFVKAHPPSSEEQNALEQSFNSIVCTSIELPPCLRRRHQCPPS